MAEANANEAIGRNNEVVIIVVTIVVLAVIFMFFRNRQQKRDLHLQQIDTQMDVWEEWGERQNRQMNNAMRQSSEKIL